MDVVWLESLVALGEHGSFTRAAESLHISQPAFSRRIRALEQWAGTDLVDRTSLPITLTPSGRVLRARAADVVAGLSALHDEMRGRQTMPAQPVRLAVSHSLATHYFAGWWHTITADAPQLTCLLLAANTLEAYDTLVHGGCDLLLGYVDPLHPLDLGDTDIESVLVAQDRLAPYARPGTYRLPDPDRTAADGGPEMPYVSHGAGSFLGRVTDRILAGRRPRLRPVAQSDLTSVLAALVAAGVGIGWLPGLLTAEQVAAGRMAPVGDGHWTAALEIRLSRNRRQRTSSHAAEVWERAAAGPGTTG
ncbi:LysR family transcriptional regulator [Actinocatenispora thailandica]|uniref:LysR family transcriptional regulator n=1 Tax=Actinocatenispora thailandica TaxID=227318 RepID=A0A7R7I0K5_9ACTN|nr:LysR family transcriptional regulator [Actinocatenispora thailandica]BCJ38706.1 LysR family transcriptional regulator [Actinocatenispora thailandica]